MKYTTQIANRYLRSKRRTGFISLITYLSAGGVALGAAALVIVLSIMNGFEDEVRSRIIGADAPVRVSTFSNAHADWREAKAIIDTLDKVEAVSPYILEKGMIRHNSYMEGCIVRGVDPETVGEVNDIPRMLLAGELKNLRPSGDDDTPGIILGRYLADVLYATPGDTIYLLAPSQQMGPFSQPKVGIFEVVGVFESGLAEFDQAFALLDIKEAQRMYNMGDFVSGLDVKTTTLDDAHSVKEAIMDQVGYPWFPRTWFEMRKTLFSWMQLEKWAMFIVLSLIIVVAAFNIVSTLVMVTMEKRKEIGILLAMGATKQDVSKIFILQGFFVGVVGTSIGLLIGLGLLWAQLKYKFFSLPSDVYMISSLPVKMQVTDFVAVGIAGVLLCLVAAVYPARRAASLDPVEAIRYE